MPRKPIAVRFDPLVLDFVSRQATRSGISISDFIVGAALTRAALSLASEDPKNVDELLTLSAQATEIIRALGNG